MGHILQCAWKTEARHVFGHAIKRGHACTHGTFRTTTNQPLDGCETASFNQKNSLIFRYNSARDSAVRVFFVMVQVGPLVSTWLLSVDANGLVLFSCITAQSAAGVLGFLCMWKHFGDGKQHATPEVGSGLMQRSSVVL